MKKYLISVLSLALLSMSNIASADDSKPYISLRFLTPELASKAVIAAVEDCTVRGYKVSAALVDRTGNMVAFLRNPLSGAHTVRVAEQKAYSAASLQTATSQMADREDLNFAPGILLIVGGLPIDVGGHLYGGIAVAGADPKVDEECAQTGIDAIVEVLDFAD